MKRVRTPEELEAAREMLGIVSEITSKCIWCGEDLVTDKRCDCGSQEQLNQED